MVRCGACRELFNAREHLLHSVEDMPPLDTPTSDDDLEGRMTLVDFGSLRANQPNPPSNMQDELDALSKAISDLQSNPWSDTKDAELSAEPPPMMAIPTPSFVEEARQRERSNNSWKWLLWLGIPLLVTTLLIQLAYFYRAEISARSPEAGRYLKAACSRLGCKVLLPEHIDRLSLESSQLQPVQDHPGQFTLTALIRNQSDTVQAWPSLDLQLKTDVGQVLVRKVFDPLNYLSAIDVKKGIAAHAEQEFQINFELSGESPGGFSIDLFYH